jgi:siroheme synthase
MSTNVQASETALPDLDYGSVWLVGAGDGDPRKLSPLALTALSTADAVIHDFGLAPEILDLVKAPRYREAAAGDQAIRRTIKLAEDGWRVVLLVAGNAVTRGIDAAPSFIRQNIPFRIVPDPSVSIGRDWPFGLLLLRKTQSPDGTTPQTLVVLLTPLPNVEARANAEQRHAPLGFSMSGLAG